MQELNAEADVHLGRFPGAEDRYRAITAKMTEYLNQERRLAGDPNTGVARSQLVVTMTQGSIAMDQLHNAADSLKTSLQMTVQPVAEGAADLAQRCRTAVPPGALTPTETQTRSDACSEFFPAYDAFRQKFGAVTQGLLRLEEIYERERKTQQGLLQTAEQIQ